MRLSDGRYFMYSPAPAHSGQKREQKVQDTQVGKGSSEEKNDQWILTSKFVMGMFMWFKIAKNKNIHEAFLEGRWYAGRMGYVC